MINLSKLDLSRELKDCYKAKRKPDTVYVPEGRFLSVLGKGDPNGEEYQEAIGALYSWAYTLKFHYKGQDLDFKVMPLEGHWWINDCTFDMNYPAPREDWRWRAFIRVPDYVSEEAMQEHVTELSEKKGEKVREVSIWNFREGISAQIMHIGPYSEETPTINALHKWVEESGYRLRGLHHEIYLSDPRRSKPENLKTIIRHPLDELGLG